MALRAEHASLTEWLRTSLTPEERGHIGIVSLNQWPFTCAVVGEVAVTARAMGSAVTVGMWADATPLPDPGWTTSRALASLLFSRSIDRNLERALIHAGLPRSAIARPPIRHWTPVGLPAVPDPVNRTAIRALRYHGSPMGRSILQVHPDGNTPIRDEYVWPRPYTERAVESYAWVYDQVSELIRRRGITTLVVFNGRFTHDQAAAAAAEAQGVRVLYYDSGGLETGFDLTFASTHDWADLQHRMLRMWAAWPEHERAEIGRTWFLNRRAHKEPGLRAFVEFQEKGNLAGVPDADILVAFFSSSPDEIAELELDWSEYLGSQPQALATLADAVRATPGAELVVRTHPHMRLKPQDDLVQWRAAVAAAEPTAHFDAADPLDSYELMTKADVVFTYGSTSGVEAAFVGRPVVVMGPSAYDLLGCVTRARTAEDVRTALQQPITLPSENALPYGLMMQRRGFNFESVTVTERGTFALCGTPLDDARSMARKIGDARKQRRMSRLLSH
jgi:Capsule polysaccharide biosynthesis protein